MSERLIHLRRPATLSVVDAPFVPQVAGSVLREAERRWRELCDLNPAYFDGRLYQVLGVHRNGYGGASLHVVECAYRYFAVQSPAFDLGVRPLGTKGITVFKGRVLFGRRAASVAAYRGQWELAPGGVADVGRTPVETICAELREEAGLVPATDPIPVALAYDEVIRTWELVFRIEPRTSAPAAGAAPTTDEYDEIRWCAPDAPPAPLTPIAERMLDLI